MTDKKRDRNNDEDKAACPSPNRRSPKNQKQLLMEQKTEENEVVPMETGPKANSNDPATNLINKFEGVSSDWKNWIQEKNRKGWETGILPAPTKYWYELSKGKQRIVEGFIPEDLIRYNWPLVMKDGFKDLKILYQLEEKKTGFWEDLSQALVQDTGKMLQCPHAKAFKCLFSLSTTDPSHLPKAQTKDGITFFPDSLVAELWITSIAVFGFTTEVKKINVLFSANEKIAPTTAEWKARDVSGIVGFSESTLFTDDDDGAHDRFRTAKNKLLKEGHSKEHWRRLSSRSTET
jgi:hypothetical protein